jgi:hypothetical protein
MEGKLCSTCEEFTTYKNFHKKSSSKDGYKSSCKLCRKAKQKNIRKRVKEYRNNEYAINRNTIKKCNMCFEKKSTSEFYFSANCKSGTATYCKDCSKQLSRGRYNNKYKHDESFVLKKANYCKKHWKEAVSSDKKEIKKEETRLWRLQNKEHVSNYNKKYKEKNKGLCRELASRRRFQKINAYPEWVSRKELQEIYKNSPDKNHVDHIIPLIHPEICGLHVPWNLQYLPYRENCSKSNKFDGTYENETWRTEVRFYEK